MKKNKYIVIIISVLVVIIPIILFFYSSTGKKVINYFTPQPETFTELYFENHTLLPSVVEAGQTYTFSFTAHSEEYKDMTYPYSIYILDNNKKIPVQKGTFTLHQDQKKTIKETFTAPPLAPPLLSNRAEVVVNLDNKNQSIDFWIHE